MNFHQFEKGSLGWHGILTKAFETKKKEANISIGNRDKCFPEALHVKSDVKINCSMICLWI